jgi:hypothetical protein
MFGYEQERSDINLDNPIFVCYINTANFTRQRVVEIMEQTKNGLDIYNNVTMWFIASDRDEIVCVYDGWGRNRDSEIKDLISEINTKIEILSQSHSFDDFKIRVRDWRINELVNGSQENEI